MEDRPTGLKLEMIPPDAGREVFELESVGDAVAINATDDNKTIERKTATHFTFGL